MKESTVQQMDSWLAPDNCRSRSEFVDKAIRFYIGYLTTDNVSDYLGKTLVSSLQGIIEENNNRQRSLLFKLCVELNMAMHIIAAYFHADESNRRELRAFAVEEVKRTNGQISFERAVEIQSQPREEGQSRPYDDDGYDDWRG